MVTNQTNSKSWVDWCLAPRGPGVRLLSALFLVGGGYWAVRQGLGRGDFSWALLFIAYLFLRGFTWFRWYSPGTPRAGIEDHFDKASVIGIWLCAIAGGISLLTGTVLLNYLVLLPLAFFMFWNVVLVYFHLHDHDPMAPNALSGDSRHF